MDLRNRKVLIIGTGLSGIGAAKLLERLGAVPVLYDENLEVKKTAVLSKLPKDSKGEVVIGSLPEDLVGEIVLVVPSPGVSVEAEIIKRFQQKEVPVWGEIELAYRYAKGRLIGITGTNGKTTTTSLIGQIMEEYYRSVYVVGNIGNPYTEIALETKDDTVVVAEISSFQLETTENFRPQVSAILNITPDHLDRHHSMENYAAVKERIAENQTDKEVCVLNYENEYTKAFAERCSADVLFFSSVRRLRRGIYLEGEDIYLAGIGPAAGSDRKKIMTIHDMNLVGICNVENVMAAIAVALSAEVPLAHILDTIKRFQAVEHRIEFVATKSGVDYYNDSKGTNPDAAIHGIRAMSKPTVLIGGGYDKQSEYDEWIEAFDGKVKAFVLIGQTADKIENCARRHGIENIFRADSFEEALKICTREAVSGDAVLLSPACASWGMFPNYEVRGKVFKDYVNAL